MDGLTLLNSPVPKRPHPNGITWATRTSAADDNWLKVAYGHAGFCAVSSLSSSQPVMTSTDGTTGWTLRTIANVAGSFTPNDVAYGNGTYVIVGPTGVDLVRTSTDTATWANRSASSANSWRSVCFGNGRFVAISGSGTGDRAMYSDDNGASWTAATTPTPSGDLSWRYVAYGGGVYVAVGDTGTGTRVMTSATGTAFTLRTSAADNSWRSVCWGNGVWVKVAITGTGTRAAYSLDNGVTWAIADTPPPDNDWRAVTWANGLFVAVAVTGTGNRVATSPNGRIWTSRTSAADNNWTGLAYGNGTLVAVGQSGTGTRVMTCQD